MSTTIRVATRGSILAVTQTRQVVRMLEERNPDFRFEIITLTTMGDKVTDRPLSQFRGAGVFVKELENALVHDQADIAVHSLKDVPIDRVEGLCLSSFPPRKDPSDLLLTGTGVTFNELPRGAIIGTSSPRRLVQLQASKPELAFKDLRGNLDTRLRKLEEGRYDGIVAAAAGMLRMGRQFIKENVLPFEVCLPAAGQGCLAIECRSSDDLTIGLTKTIDDEKTRSEVLAERAFIETMGGNCTTPVAVYASIGSDTLVIKGMVGDPETKRIVRDTLVADMNNIMDSGKILAEKMISLCKEKEIRISPI